MVRKLINVLLAVFMFYYLPCYAQETSLGEEFIEPLKYPKFSLGSGYILNRKFHGFADSALRYDLENRFDGEISFEAGLYKYMNAGALFSFVMSDVRSLEPIFMGLTIFAKPYLPLGNRFSFFSRIGGGLGWGFLMVPSILEHLTYLHGNEAKDINRVYHGQTYESDPYGGIASVTVGIEFFPFSRLGLAVEGGIRSYFLHSSRNTFFTEAPESKSGAPSSLNYMVYELPLTLTLEIIL